MAVKSITSHYKPSNNSNKSYNLLLYSPQTMSDGRCACPNFNYHNNCGKCDCSKHQHGAYDNQFWCSKCNRNFCSHNHLRTHIQCNGNGNGNGIN